MKRYKISISQNGWEYTGYAWITCEDIKKVKDDTVLIDNKYKLRFDEEIGDIEESNNDDEDYNFIETVYK